jgi:hypothetical protein
MNVNWTQVHDFLDVLVLIFGLAAMAMLFWLRGIFVSKATMTEAAAAMEKGLGKLADRVAELERRTDGKAAKDEVRRLDIEHAKLSGVFERVDRSVSALERAVERIEDILLKEKD